MAEPRPGSRAGPVPRWLGRLAEPFYAAAIARRNAAFDAGRGVTRLDVPVISVGNLSVGGTGKTPMVMHIVGALRRAGRKPCIAMRGYKGRERGTGNGGQGADETDAYRRTFGDVPIVAQADRLAGLRALVRERPGVYDNVVLDDGFQHRRIARDLDIVLIDATRPPEHDRLLPAGWLREPPANLRRAHAVVITHAECVTPAELDSLARWIERTHGKPPLAVTRHLWTGLTSSREADRLLPLDALAHRRVFAACAIGNPDAFLRTLELTAAGVGAEVVGTLILSDHDPFADATVTRLIAAAKAARADAIVVTDKDWSKLRRIPDSQWPAEVRRPVLTMAFDAGAADLERAVLSAARA